MPSVSELLRSQLQFTIWANERTFAAANALSADELAHDFKSADKSILGTLVHIHRAERIWLLRIKGEAASFKVDGDDTLAALAANWPAIGKGWMEWAGGLTDAGAAEKLTYSDLKGNSWTQPVSTLIQHVANHSTHHRGQAIGFMRALGHTPPNVDLIAYARELDVKF